PSAPSTLSLHDALPICGLDPRVVKRLRRGEFALQGHVDLHGLLKGEAKSELEAFLARSRQQGKRCVLVVHGRGLHSKDQVPVLKDRKSTRLNSSHVSIS